MKEVRNVVAALLVLFPAVMGEAAAQEPAAYLLEPLLPGDAVVLTVWREPDFSGVFRVDPRGIIVLPRLGRIDVSGRTPRDLEEQILRELSVGLNHTSIEVGFTHRISIQGAVREPGMYDVEPTLTVADALARAGGTTPEGDPEKVQLTRDEEALPVTLTERSVMASARIRSGDQLYVPERSWLARNPGTVAAVVSGVLSVFLILVR